MLKRTAIITGAAKGIGIGFNLIGGLGGNVLAVL